MNLQQRPGSLRIPVALAATLWCGCPPAQVTDAGSMTADAAAVQLDAGGGLPDARPDARFDASADAGLVDTGPVDTGPGDTGPGDTGPGDSGPTRPVLPPVASIAAASTGFRLFYRERLQRALLAHNRFGMFGDVGFAVGNGHPAVARNGSSYQVVVAPRDNNPIGRSIYETYQAYRIYRSRALELTLLRMFNGLVFLEAVTGHPGLTVREALPGWTALFDGVNRTVARDRGGAPVVSHPLASSPQLEHEILGTFFSDVVITYREDPSEYYFSYLPVARLESYALTYSHSALPRFLRISDCCSSFMRTPEPHAWAGAFWGNHNSRDNFPDLALGYLAALVARDDTRAPPELRAAAEQAVAAMHRTGDLVMSNGSALMTVDEFHDYGTLTVGGDVRPHGLEENQDLGTLPTCASAYLARAMSTPGLALPLPEVALTSSMQDPLTIWIGDLLGCPDTTGGRTCHNLDDGWCDRRWNEFPELQLLGLSFFDGLALAGRLRPDLLAGLAGAQNDFEDIADTGLALTVYARAVGDAALLQQAQVNLAGLTALMRGFADLLWADTDPARRDAQYWRAALLDAMGGLATSSDALQDWGEVEAAMAAREALLDQTAEAPWPLLTDDVIAARVAAALVGLADHPSGRDDVIRQRYADAYGDTPPLRRSGAGYEAMRAGGAWQAAENPRHHDLGLGTFLPAMSLCIVAPAIVDCTWAILGCGAADLDADGAIDQRDLDRFDAAFASGQACDAANAWCSGLDLDHTGVLDALDRAYLEVAQGCRSGVAG